MRQQLPLISLHIRRISHKAIPLSFKKLAEIWIKSFQPNRLQVVQNELVNFMLQNKISWEGQATNIYSNENLNVKINNEKVAIDQENYINEINFEIINNTSLNSITKHVVFIHGYGASLGCFARNWQMFHLFKDMKYNYKFHFLDNLSFGLSSNPHIATDSISPFIPKCPDIKITDNKPTEPKKLYNKYYKLVDSFEIDNKSFSDYKQLFGHKIKHIEEYYLSGLNKWREAQGIEIIDYLVGHSYGGYWSGSYAVKYPRHVGQLILLSPVGVERHFHALTSSFGTERETISKYEPTLDPSEFNFLTRHPILEKTVIRNWYFQAYLPRILKWMGPWGVKKYWEMWYMKLFKINKLINKRRFQSHATNGPYDLVYGTDEEIRLIIEYLFNSITSGTVSDIYIKYLLTPSTVSKVPLFDKFINFITETPCEYMALSNQKWSEKFKVHFVYGQYDFMNFEAGEKLASQINKYLGNPIASIHKVTESGHNLYIDNPFDTNVLIHDIIKQGERFDERTSLDA